MRCTVQRAVGILRLMITSFVRSLCINDVLYRYVSDVIESNPPGASRDVTAIL